MEIALPHSYFLLNPRLLLFFCETFSTASSGTKSNKVKKSAVYRSMNYRYYSWQQRNKAKKKNQIDTWKKDFARVRATIDYSNSGELKRNLSRTSET